jgi:hypothetical protein
MTSNKRENSVHVRLSDEADAALELMCQAGGHDKAKLSAQMLEDALLGRCHALKVAAHRFARLGIAGIDREQG